jgi:hypothetical protein
LGSQDILPRELVMEFVWNDGGRAAAGFVGLTGDCVTRAIAIATGSLYRDVYAELGKSSQKSPRKGIPTDIAAAYLATRGWQQTDGGGAAFDVERLPKGVVIVHLGKTSGRAQHFCTIIDQVVHDTWNPADDDDYSVLSYWSLAASTAESSRLPTASPKRQVSREQEMTQQEFDKILRRLKAMDNTASNDASTEGEKRNALRMMQTLMLRHNLTREDIVDNDNVDSVQFSRISCPVNGRRACAWEKSLAGYVTRHIFPSVQWYLSPHGHRTIFTFYGPVSDVKNGLALFRELLLTIATAAQLRYGGYVRGSGASYAEGYVAGLPRSQSQPSAPTGDVPSGETAEAKEIDEGALIQTRTLALQEAAGQWLRQECNLSLVTTRRAGRQHRDPSAESRGRRDGATHEVVVPNAPKRITRQ